MDFLKPEVRNYFFKQDPEIYSKVSDLPPAKYNPGASVKNSLVGSGSIINGTVENSVIFKQVFVGNNCVIKNSIILNDVYLGAVSYTHLDVYKRQVQRLTRASLMLTAFIEEWHDNVDTFCFTTDSSDNSL